MARAGGSELMVFQTVDDEIDGFVNGGRGGGGMTWSTTTGGRGWSEVR
jgi:hypothetical protein